LKYTNSLDTHEVMFRFSSATLPGVAMGSLVSNGVLSAIAGLMTDDGSTLGAEWRNSGSHIFLPVAFDGWDTLTFTDPSAATPISRGRFISAQARSVSGPTKAKYTLFPGYEFGDVSYRSMPGEWAAADDYWGAVELMALEGDLRAADDAQVIVHRYANVGLNAHYQRKART
jgi:hypothetical protein